MGLTAEGLECESQYGQEFLHVVQTGSGAHPTSTNPMGTGTLSPGVKRPRREADHTSKECWGQENVELYSHSPIRLHDSV
jgi:hypothetical protein